MDSARHSQSPFLTESSAPNQVDHQTEAAPNPNPRLAALAEKSTVIGETAPRTLPTNEKAEPVFER